MPPEAVEALAQALDDAGLAATSEVYAGAAHGYTMADTSMYDEAATERHFVELEELLDRTLLLELSGRCRTAHRWGRSVGAGAAADRLGVGRQRGGWASGCRGRTSIAGS